MLAFSVLFCILSISRADECLEDTALVQLRSDGQGLPYTLQAYCGAAWLTDCSQVPAGWEQHPGAFQPSLNYEPLPSATANSDASKNYLTFGGFGVDSGTIPTASYIVENFKKTNTGNVDFDMEGKAINDNYRKVAELFLQMKKEKPSAKTQFTNLVSASGRVAGIEKSHPGAVDFLAVMIHADSMVGDGYSIPEGDPKSGQTWPWIKRWLDADIENSKIILQLTTVGLQGYMIDWFKELIKEHGLAGMSFWKWKQLSPEISLECIQNPAVACKGSVPSTTGAGCLARCTNDAPCVACRGECCDVDSSTAKGSCQQLGQEGCCGGTGQGKSYCQLS